jgi:hypothetical protein
MQAASSPEDPTTTAFRRSRLEITPGWRGNFDGIRFSFDITGEGLLYPLYHGRTSLSMHFERRLVQLSGESQYITLNIERRPAAGKIPHLSDAVREVLWYILKVNLFLSHYTTEEDVRWKTAE